MTTEDVTVQPGEEKPVPSFLKDKHELAKLFKSLDKASQAAVKLLTETLESTDKDVTLKMKLECAERLLDFYMRTAKQISDDDMARLIAEVKLGGSKQGFVLKEGERPAQPVLNFSEIKAT